MGKIKEAAEVWRKIFRNWRYVFLVFLVAFIFYLLNGLILNIKNIGSSYQIFDLIEGTFFLFKLSVGFLESAETFNAVGIIVLSFLIGALVSILTYRFRTARSARPGKYGLIGGIGLFLGTAAPGCAACGLGLVSILGLSSAFAVLPFKGKEIIVLA